MAWYNESIGEPALKDPEGIKDEYADRIKERLEYFSQNLGYTFNFYTKKLASMCQKTLMLLYGIIQLKKMIH